MDLTHPLFSVESKCIQIIAYFDKVVQPLRLELEKA